MKTCLTIKGSEWSTPLTSVEPRRVRGARVRRISYTSGIYEFEGQRGYDYYEVKGRLPVTVLELRNRPGWKMWMVDDPLHWIGMGERVADLPAGSVLVAGLGLGLMLHHMKARPDLTSITVVERDPAVIDLISPTTPSDPRVEIVEADYYDYIERPGLHPDSVLWDLAVGSGEDAGFSFARGRYLTQRALPNAPLYCFGLRGRKPVPPLGGRA